jgi:ABC-2 type transport system permease protein
MVWTIARKELLETFRDGRFRVAALVVLALALASLGAGWKHYREVRTEHDEARLATHQQWLNQPKKNPHSAAHYGIYAFKPKTQLSMVDTGIDPYVGVLAWLEAHRQNEFKYRPAQDRTAVHRFGELSAAAVLQVLLPLFIILMAFPAFAGERESGTLRQVLSLGIPRDRLLLGKAIGIAGALSLVLLPTLVLGVAALTMTADTGQIAGYSARGVLMFVAYLIYLAIFVCVSLAVSARLSSSRLALVTLLGFWMFNSLIIPRVAVDIADRMHPIPSAIAFKRAMDRDLSDTREVEARLAVKRASLLEQYKVSNVNELPVAFSGVSLQEGEEHGNQVFDRHYAALFDTYERQNRTAVVVGAVAPLVAIQSLSMSLAATDFAHHRRFVAAAEEHRRMMQRVLNNDIFERQKPGEVYMAGADLWGRIPAFEYELPSTGWALARQLPAIALLAVWALAAILWAGWTVRHAAAG